MSDTQGHGRLLTEAANRERLLLIYGGEKDRKQRTAVRGQHKLKP